jgi:hypothetical protein
MWNRKKHLRLRNTASNTVTYRKYQYRPELWIRICGSGSRDLMIKNCKIVLRFFFSLQSKSAAFEMRIRIRGYKTLVLSQLLYPTDPSAEAKPYSARLQEVACSLIRQMQHNHFGSSCQIYFFNLPNINFFVSKCSIIISDPAVKFTSLTYPI